jgi:hypothetical protein
MGAVVAWLLRAGGGLCRAPPSRWHALLGRHGCYRHWLDAGLFDALLQAVAAVPSRPRAQDRTTMLASDAGKRYWLLDLSVV